MEMPSTELEESEDGSGLGDEISFGHVKFGMSIRHPS